MVNVGLVIRLQAQPGKEGAVAQFLEGAMPYVQREPKTTALLMVRFGPSEFGIVNAFPDEAGRQAHMTGQAAEALFAQAPTLFAQAPSVEPIDIIASKLPA